MINPFVKRQRFENIYYTYNIDMIRGDTYKVELTFDPEEFPVAGDLIELTVRPQPNAKKLIYKQVTEFTSNEDNIVTITIDPVDTQYANPGNYHYDVSLTKEDGTVTTIVGPAYFTIKGDITHPD